MTEDDFTKVMAPKIKGARVLHNAFHGSDLEFFVMFGSAGIGDRITRPRQLRRRQRGPGCLRALPAGTGFAGSHNRLGPVVSGDGRRTQAGEDLRATGDRAHHPCGGHPHPRSTHQPEDSQRHSDQRRLGAGSPRWDSAVGFPRCSPNWGRPRLPPKQAIRNHRYSTFCQHAQRPKGSSWSPAMFNKSLPQFLRSLPPISVPTTLSMTSAWTL